ncbi:outer membrane beta-barrel protein [Tenacibaculum agarivorans]|uniref:outer membrane beta-barrel protein n=1 Tax=Tenacibaculum agarivorans TaxID=1908389 RepID=UPI00094BA53E|nr:outer membrane beta-barrel protein [Tenacibaculum agarivorans]
MKKLLLTIAVIALGFTANAQKAGFNVGANLGLPIGDASDLSSFVLGVEANYLFEASEEFLVGPSLSFVNYFGKDVEILGVSVSSDANFLPIAAAARYMLSEEFSLGADLGYAIGLNTGNEGGFYYRPMVGYNISEKVMLQATYSGVSADGGSLSNIGLGVMFGL